MATLTIVPTGAGLLTQLSANPSGLNWQKAALTGALGSGCVAVFGAGNTSVSPADLYAATSRSFTTETINSVAISILHYQSNPPSGGLDFDFFQVGFNDGVGTYWYGNNINGSVSTTNPRTSSAWTVSQVNALQIGIKLIGSESNGDSWSLYANGLSSVITYTAGGGGVNTKGNFMGFFK